MIIIFSKKKTQLVLKAIANTVIMCTTNQNGKTAYNCKAGNTIGLTLPDLQKLNKIGHRLMKKPKKQNV
ncbi:MAG: hypothetical protein IMY72_11885 [Bacteroidetes bacterium]|nr:hypothetical protein [Bacteroidota bacterium]